MENTALCKKCKQEIWFANINGSSVPVDIEPIKVKKAGSYISTEGKFQKYGVGQLAFQSHYATCPYASYFRKRVYAKKKSDNVVSKNILIHDLAGMQIILGKCKTLNSLRNRWLEQWFQKGLKSLSPEDHLAITQYKDELKNKLSEREISIFND